MPDRIYDPQDQEEGPEEPSACCDRPSGHPGECLYATDWVRSRGRMTTVALTPSQLENWLSQDLQLVIEQLRMLTRTAQILTAELRRLRLGESVGVVVATLEKEGVLPSYDSD